MADIHWQEMQNLFAIRRESCPHLLVFTALYSGGNKVLKLTCPACAAVLAAEDRVFITMAPVAKTCQTTAKDFTEFWLEAQANTGKPA